MTEMTMTSTMRRRQRRDPREVAQDLALDADGKRAPGRPRKPASERKRQVMVHLTPRVLGEIDALVRARGASSRSGLLTDLIRREARAHPVQVAEGMALLAEEGVA